MAASRSKWRDNGGLGLSHVSSYAAAELEHEYYASLDMPLTHTEDLQTGYTVGDLAFWTPGNRL